MKCSTLKTASVLALALAAGACDNGLTDINQNPNAPTDVAARFIFANGTQDAVGRILGANFNLTLTELWSQQVAKIQYIDEDRYELRDATVNAHWAGLYAGPLTDFEMVEAKGAEANQPNVTAQGTIMQMWTFQAMTDVWGDIPFSEALKGRAESRITTPVYDKQADIYAGMLSQLKAASASINPGGPAITGGDLIYGGDMAAWKRFSNSLRLRMAMRVADVNPTLARSEFVAALGEGVFRSNADNAVLKYGGNPSENPIHENFHESGRFDHVISATLVDTLKALSDPRLPVYATPAPSDGAYRGMENGLSNDHGIKFSTLSRIGDYFLAPDAPAVLMSYSEVLFLMAEAAQRGWIPGSAAQLYQQAITAAMKMYGIADSAISAYLAQPRVAFNAATGLEQIALQRWISLFMNGPEAYAEYRRSGVPNLRVVRASANGNQIPVRVFYPSSEQAFNSANLQAAIARNGGATLNDRVWWDVR